MPRVAAARGGQALEAEVFTRGAVGGDDEAGDGVRGDGGGVLGVRVGDAGEAGGGVAVGDEKLGVAVGERWGEEDLRGGVAGEGAGIGGARGGAYGVRDHLQAAVVGEVADGVGGQGGGELAEEVVVDGLLVGRGVEDAVAGTGAGGHVDGGARGDLQGFGVDVEDADEVGAEVRHDEELVHGIHEDLVRVGGGLSLSVGAGLHHGEVEVLERGVGGGDGVDFPCGDSPSVVSDGQELGSVGAGEKGGVYGGIGDDGVLDWCQGLVVDLQGSQAAVANGHSLVQTKKVPVLDIDLQP